MPLVSTGVNTDIESPPISDTRPSFHTRIPSSQNLLSLSPSLQSLVLSQYPEKTRQKILDSPQLSLALSRPACASTYFFTLRYGNYGGVWYHPRHRPWPHFISKRGTIAPVDVLDLVCALFGEDDDIEQFRRVVRVLRTGEVPQSDTSASKKHKSGKIKDTDTPFLLSRGARVYADEILSSYFGAGILYVVWKFWLVFYIIFIILGALILPSRPYAGALNGLFLIDGVFDFLGSSSLRTGTKFAIWSALWSLDRVATPVMMPSLPSPLMSIGLLFLRSILVITSMRCASNKMLSEHEYIRIQNEDEWREINTEGKKRRVT